jgi:hypothetical protein
MMNWIPLSKQVVIIESLVTDEHRILTSHLLMFPLPPPDLLLCF